VIARAARARQEAADLTGDSKTDTINRAVQVYAYLEEINSRGGTIYTREPGGLLGQDGRPDHRRLPAARARHPRATVIARRHWLD
jgi:hypothetical protein